MQTDYMLEMRQTNGTTGGKLASTGRAVLAGLVLALFSPIAPLAPKRFARWFATHPAAVPAWQIAMLQGYTIYEFISESYGESEPRSLLGLGFALPYLLILGLLWLLGSYMVRPLGSAWDETPRRSFWKSGLVLLAFVLPLPFVLGEVSSLLRSILMPSGDGDYVNWHKLSILGEAAGLGLFWAAVVQIVRGLASIGGRTLPALPPICRDCGYSLEGVTDLYEAGRPRDESDPAIPRVCPECGCQITVSLDPTVRPGTAWTRGEHLSLASWGRTLGQVMRQPARFYAQLPLDASRRAALWFWAANILVAALLVTAVFAGDYMVCTGTKVMSPLLPGISDSFAVPTTTSQPVAMAPVSPAISIGLWLLDCLNRITGVMLAIAGLSTLVLALSANRISRLMSKHRGMNLHPTGLLLMGYLSPVALAVGLAVLGVFVAMRLIGEVCLPLAPMGIRRYVDDPGVLGEFAALLSLIPSLFWYHLVTKRAGKGIQYANQ